MEEKNAGEQALQTETELQGQTEAQPETAAENGLAEATAGPEAQPVPTAESGGQAAVPGEIGELLPSETAQPQVAATEVPLHTQDPGERKEKEGIGVLMVVTIIVLLVVIIGATVALLLLRKRESTSTELNDPQVPDEPEPRMEGGRKKRKPSRRAEEKRDESTTVFGDEPDMEEVGKTESGGAEGRFSPELETTAFIGSPASHPRFVIGGKATIGGRAEQQDSAYFSEWKDTSILDQRGLLVAVADGIGGLQDGALASEAAMQAMGSSFIRGVFNSRGSKKLLSLVAAAQQNVLNLNQSGHQCGCTLVTVLIENWDLYMASVGDSRIYLYRGGGLIVLNREHTLQRENDERMAVAHEEVSPDNLRRGKAITSYLGKVNLRLIDRTTYPLRLLPGDRIALMSDGIFGTLSDEEIAEALRKPPQEAAEAMVASIDARKNPRQDNATVVVIAVE